MTTGKIIALTRQTFVGKVMSLFVNMLLRLVRMWPTGEGNGKPLQYSYLEYSMKSMKRQRDRTLKDEIPRLVTA